MLVYFKTPDERTQGQNDCGRRTGGVVTARVGLDGSYIEFTNSVHLASGERQGMSK